MSRIAIAGVIVAVGIAAWLLITENPSTQEDLTPDPGAAPPVETPDPGTLSVRPGEIPDLVEYELQSPARLLMIARLRSTWTATVELTLDGIKKLDYRTWYMVSTEPGGPAGGFAGGGRGLPELTRAPTADFLRDNEIEALVFDEVDPNLFAVDFWEAVAERVRTGRMGLYFRPGVPFDEQNRIQTSHPALAHPVLKELLPVKSALDIKGSPVPGVFSDKQLLKPTEAGYKHPATELIPVEQGSLDIWERATTGQGALGSKFCYPVQEIKSDAVVLINLEAGVEIPAVIVSTGGKARVLWMGNTDFGDRQTHFVREKNVIQKTLLNHWCVWLVGQSPN